MYASCIGFRWGVFVGFSPGSGICLCSVQLFLGCSQKYGPLLVIDYITATNSKGYQNGAFILGAIHLFGLEVLGLP